MFPYGALELENKKGLMCKLNGKEVKHYLGLIKRTWFAMWIWIIFLRCQADQSYATMLNQVLHERKPWACW